MKKCLKCGEEKSLSDYRTSRGRNGKNYLLNKCKSCSYKLQNENKSRAKVIIDNARRRAKKKGLEFNLKVSEIELPTHCPVFGFELDYTHSKSHFNSPSLDRTDNSVGYTKENSRIISQKANQIKNNSSVEELELLLKYLKEI